MKTEELNQNHVSLLRKKRIGSASARPSKLAFAFGLPYFCRKLKMNDVR